MKDSKFILLITSIFQLFSFFINTSVVIVNIPFLEILPSMLSVTHSFFPSLIYLVYITRSPSSSCDWKAQSWCYDLISSKAIVSILSILKRPWCWERLKTGGGGNDRGWDGWMASLTQWTWVWVNCRSWWWRGGPGVLQSMGSQRIGHDWSDLAAAAAEQLNWTELISTMTHALSVYSQLGEYMGKYDSKKQQNRIYTYQSS